MANEGPGGDTVQGKETERESQRERERRKNGGVGLAKGGEEKPERRYRTLPKGGELRGGPKGGGEYEGDPDEEWKKRARGKRGRAVKAGGGGGEERAARGGYRGRHCDAICKH